MFFRDHYAVGTKSGKSEIEIRSEDLFFKDQHDFEKISDNRDEIEVKSFFFRDHHDFEREKWR